VENSMAHAFGWVIDTWSSFSSRYLDFWEGQLLRRCETYKISTDCCNEVANAAVDQRLKIYLSLWVMFFLGMLIFMVAARIKPCTPRYWKGKRWRRPFNDGFYAELDVTRQYRDAVQELFDVTRANAGTGTKARVVKVTRIENFLLWTQYQTTMSSMRSKDKNLNDMKNDSLREDTEKGIRDVEDMLDGWRRTHRGGLGKFVKSLKLNRYKNETLLFHSAAVGRGSTSAVDVIKKIGFDNRLGNTSGILGSGLHFADTPSKADCDVGIGEASIFLARVTLGCPYMTEKSLELMRRPPCIEGHFDIMLQYDENQPEHGPPWVQKGLPLDLCNHHRLNSVISGHTVDGQDRPYKEYAVFGPQCYPEFLVDYVNYVCES